MLEYILVVKNSACTGNIFSLSCSDIWSVSWSQSINRPCEYKSPFTHKHTYVYVRICVCVYTYIAGNNGGHIPHLFHFFAHAVSVGKFFTRLQNVVLYHIMYRHFIKFVIFVTLRNIMKILKINTESNAYFRRVVLLRFPAHDADVLHEVDFTYCAMHGWFNIEYPLLWFG